MVIYLLLKDGLHRLNKINFIKPKTGDRDILVIPMRLRLFLFLVVLVLTMLFGIIVILLVVGAFNSGMLQSKKLTQNELHHISEGITKQYGQLSLQAVEFSKSLSFSIEDELHKKGTNISHIQTSPELLEDIISSQYERALFTLFRSKSSGIFIILDATVNPMLINAEDSKAGLYIKNMEPNIISSSSPTIHILCGPPSISRQNSLSLHSQWSMEFNIRNAPYYNIPLEIARKQSDKLPLSRLYYWSVPLTLPGTSEEVMLCSVPLIDSKGNVFGVCGLEISAMLFKLSYMPNSTTYNRIFCMLAPLYENTINSGQSMFSGGFSARSSSKSNEVLTILKKNNSFNLYDREDGASFLGFHNSIQLYPQGSVFYGEEWISAVMIPREDIVKPTTKLNVLISFFLLLLLFLGITISLVLSVKYVKPITQGLDIIKSIDSGEVPRTKISEINDIIEFISLNNEKLYQKAQEQQLPISVLDEFIANSKALSPAERSVFNLYVQGHAAKDIAQILCLSINTIKTHTKRIYTKLNIASREELLLYVNMLKDIGQELK